jgi:hypothetical protein
MNTCGTCKHKGENIRNPKKETTYFLCDQVKHDNNDGKGCFARTESVAGKGAYVVDRSGFFAALCVEDDFGCNKWEAK